MSDKELDTLDVIEGIEKAVKGLEDSVKSLIRLGADDPRLADAAEVLFKTRNQLFFCR